MRDRHVNIASLSSNVYQFNSNPKLCTEDAKMKRKRSINKNINNTGNIKRVKISSDSQPEPKLITTSTTDKQHTPTVLKLYYPQVLTLREYLLQATQSRHKKRWIAAYGVNKPSRAYTSQGDDDHDEGFVKLLDTVLVGCHSLTEAVRDFDEAEYKSEFGIFSTQVTESTERSVGGASQNALSFAEVSPLFLESLT
jgi:hypothetical protein